MVGNLQNELGIFVYSYMVNNKKQYNLALAF